MHTPTSSPFFSFPALRKLPPPPRSFIKAISFTSQCMDLLALTCKGTHHESRPWMPLVFLSLPEEILARIVYWGTRSSPSLPVLRSLSNVCLQARVFDLRDKEALDMGPTLSLTCKVLNRIVQRHLAETVCLRGKSRIVRFLTKLNAGSVDGRHVRELHIGYKEPTGLHLRNSRLGSVYTLLRDVMQHCVRLDTLNMCSFMGDMSKGMRSRFSEECSVFWKAVPPTLKTLGISTTQHFPFVSASDMQLSGFLKSHASVERWCVGWVTPDVCRSTFELALRSSKVIDIGMMNSCVAYSAASLSSIESIHVHTQSGKSLWTLVMPRVKHVRLFYPPSPTELKRMLRCTPALRTLCLALDLRSQGTSLWQIGCNKTSVQQLIVTVDPQTFSHTRWLAPIHPHDGYDVPGSALRDGADGLPHGTPWAGAAESRLLGLGSMFGALGSKENYPSLEKVTVYCDTHPAQRLAEYHPFMGKIAASIGGPLEEANIELEVV